MSDSRALGGLPALTVALLVVALLVWWAMNGAQRRETHAGSGAAPSPDASANDSER